MNSCCCSGWTVLLCLVLLVRAKRWMAHREGGACWIQLECLWLCGGVWSQLVALGEMGVHLLGLDHAGGLCCLWRPLLPLMALCCL